jgi:hypothetical protein
MANPHPATMILRIKRRRTEEPLPYIRLEGLDGRKRNRDGSTEDSNSDVDQALTELLDSAHLEQQQEQPQASKVAPQVVHKSSAVWKRLSMDQDKKRTYRIVDALLEEEEGRETKRRKLTLLETSNQEADFPSVVSIRRKSPLKVLDPLSRSVDDSLQQAHQGTKMIREHYDFVTSNASLMRDSQKWLAWCHSAGGNILHACALWNDVEMAGELCQTREVAQLTEAVDGDGRTPYEVAQLSGHDSVCQVLEAFGGDTSNYVYDIFCLEENEVDEYEEQPMTVELKGGVGYWTPEGELILEAPGKSLASLTHVFNDDEEIDSNCEEYGGNDYPEDEDFEDFVPDQGYRNHPVDLDKEDSDGGPQDDGSSYEDDFIGQYSPEDDPTAYSDGEEM